MTDTQLRGMNMRELVVERDFTFIPKQSTDGQVLEDQGTETVISVEMKLLAVWTRLLPLVKARSVDNDLTGIAIASTSC